MASLSKDRGEPNKAGKRSTLYRILFKNRDGERKAIRLGEVSLKSARTIESHVAQLERCAFDGSAPPVATAQWLDGIGEDLRAKLVKFGLAAPKTGGKPATVTLFALITTYKARPKWNEGKQASRDHYDYGFGKLLAHFGPDHDIAAVKETDAEDFRDRLLAAKPNGGGLARASVNGICATGSMLFRYALRSKVSDSNPFEGVPRGRIATKRKAFVGVATSEAVVEALPDSEWRLLFALARWGALRVPSEPRGLRWGDIDRARETILVTSPKTEHHDGGGSRLIPLFPQLVPFIQARYDDAQPGEEFVLPMMRKLTTGAFRRRMGRVLKAAGIEAWPRVFHSLRSTRQTELEQEYPSYVACMWCGNSEAVARRHYLQVTSEHYAKAAHDPAQHTAETPRTAGKS